MGGGVADEAAPVPAPAARPGPAAAPMDRPTDGSAPQPRGAEAGTSCLEPVGPARQAAPTRRCHGPRAVAPGQARSPPANWLGPGKPGREAGGEVEAWLRAGPTPAHSPRSREKAGRASSVLRAKLLARPVQSPPLRNGSFGWVLQTLECPRLCKRKSALAGWSGLCAGGARVWTRRRRRGFSRKGAASRELALEFWSK